MTRGRLVCIRLAWRILAVSATTTLVTEATIVLVPGLPSPWTGGRQLVPWSLVPVVALEWILFVLAVGFTLGVAAGAASLVERNGGRSIWRDLARGLLAALLAVVAIVGVELNAVYVGGLLDGGSPARSYEWMGVLLRALPQEVARHTFFGSAWLGTTLSVAAALGALAVARGRRIRPLRTSAVVAIAFGVTASAVGLERQSRCVVWTADFELAFLMWSRSLYFSCVLIPLVLGWLDRRLRLPREWSSRERRRTWRSDLSTSFSSG